MSSRFSAPKPRRVVRDFSAGKDLLESLRVLNDALEDDVAKLSVAKAFDNLSKKNAEDSKLFRSMMLELRQIAQEGLEESRDASQIDYPSKNKNKQKGNSIKPPPVSKKSALTALFMKIEDEAQQAVHNAEYEISVACTEQVTLDGVKSAAEFMQRFKENEINIQQLETQKRIQILNSGHFLQQGMKAFPPPDTFLWGVSRELQLSISTLRKRMQYCHLLTQMPILLLCPSANYAFVTSHVKAIQNYVKDTPGTALLGCRPSFTKRGIASETEFDAALPAPRVELKPIEGGREGSLDEPTAQLQEQDEEYRHASLGAAVDALQTVSLEQLTFLSYKVTPVKLPDVPGAADRLSRMDIGSDVEPQTSQKEYYYPSFTLKRDVKEYYYPPFTLKRDVKEYYYPSFTLKRD
ncbi:uncharacterized protein MONBRDRAFT_31573 [Monosiga brevicollis MX1]|uniref:Uncharacterized protein n=1 Tax=Monosiga brevicollis TaxID=81824 RepID=A9UU32_MONBE|nr:uncharacterized protein MONBRDRAFT_31573 [Monosiga brevicollis MX1]EDQ91353.1 predicted protein [Monosiga brevicollis MX1]|eukprot:XP_001743775.1 hypothetical protein [Monosiga brevicollis MX1]